MTAENGLHNLPDRAAPGRAPRTRATCSCAPTSARSSRGCWPWCRGDAAFAAATRADDLYAPVAQRLGVERPVAKVAVLAAMYGQRSGAAGEALKGLERAYPVAMGLLERACRRGAARRAAAHVRRAADPHRAGSSRRARSAPTRPLDAARGPVRAQRDHPGGGGRAVQGLGGDGAGDARATSGRRWCSACTTSCWCTRRPSTPPRWRRGSTGRSTTPPGGGPAARRCGSSPTPRSSPAGRDAKD